MRRGDLVRCPKSQKSNDFYMRKKRTHDLEAILMRRSKLPSSWSWELGCLHLGETMSSGLVKHQL